MYLLDTNACLDFLLARSFPLSKRLEREFGRISVSAITAAELRVGNRTSTDPAKDARLVDVFLAAVTVMPFDSHAALVYGQVARAHGVVRHSFDRLIAAHAIAAGQVLVTNNERHFAGIAGLAIENWTQ